MFDHVFSAVVVSFFAAVMLAAAINDLRVLRISNLLVLGLAVSWPALAITDGLSAAESLSALSAGAGVLAIGFFLFCRRMIGAGDVKFAAATALWLGPLGTLAYILYSALAGGVIAGALLILRQGRLSALVPSARWIGRLEQPSTPVPYGVALAFAALLVFADGRGFAAF